MSEPSDLSPEAALQQTLAAEHAAMYVLGVCAAQTSVSQQPALWQQLDAAWEIHRRQRNELTALLRRRGQQPVAAEASYVLPTALGTPGQVVRGARRVEERISRTYAAQIAATVDRDRRWAIAALTAAAERTLWFRGAPEILPGTTAG